MGLRYSQYVSDTTTDTFGCAHCRTHLSTRSNILSKDYRGRTGDAYLMDKVINVVQGEKEFRSMITGKYLVSNSYCHQCGMLVGWKYHKSLARDQMFKEGKHILELKMIVLCR